MVTERSNQLKFALALSLLVAAVTTPAASAQENEGVGSRHICPQSAMRNGKCDPNPSTGKGGSLGSAPHASNRQPQYKRTAKQPSTAAKCNQRVKAAQLAKNQSPCKLQQTSAAKEDLPASTQRVGVTIWRVREARSSYTGAKLLQRQGSSGVPVVYQAERIEGDPLIAYGDKVRLGIESPRDGYLYVFDRELYHDGSLSEAHMIFPTMRLRNGDNRIRANRPVELPALTDVPIYLEAKPIGRDSSKKLVGEVLSIVITERPLGVEKSVGDEPVRVPSSTVESLENLYTGRGEVFDLEEGQGEPYFAAERDAASDAGGRMLTHNDPPPQTLYLVEDKGNGGLMVSLAIKYESSNERALLIGIEHYPDPIAPAPGATNDVLRWERLLRDRYGFAPAAIKRLVNEQASDANIREAIRSWLIAQTNPGDRVFLFFGGHGAQVPDEDRDETEDGRDEAMVPYDAEIALVAPGWVAPTANFITDDDVSQWLAELSGRRVVFVFDSCSSGTISRGGRVDADTVAGGRSLRVRGGAEQRITKFRGLIHPNALRETDAPAPIRERFLDQLVNGAVIISAAQSHQEAMPVSEVSEAPMGALTYLLTRLLDSNSTIPVSQIEEKLVAGIEQLRNQKHLRSGRNGQYQKPVVDVISKGGLEQQPIFGGQWTAAPVTALHNPWSAFRVSINFEGGRNLFYDGEPATVNVTVNRAGYLYLLVFSELDVATCLIPNGKDEPLRVEPKTYSFGDFYPQEPFGKDVWVALITDKPLPLGNMKDGVRNFKYKWSEVFDLIGLPEMQAQLRERARARGFGVKSRVTDWQAATIVVETRER